MREGQIVVAEEHGTRAPRKTSPTAAQRDNGQAAQ